MTPAATASLLLQSARIAAPPVLLRPLVRACPMPVRLGTKALSTPACSFWCGDELHILVREADPWERRRFSAAHELAHHIGGGMSDERAANALAAALLMPAEWVRAELRYYRTLRGLAERFKVSATAMRVRLGELGL